MVSDNSPYEVLSPTKIVLGPLAREWAKQHGMTEREMGQHLLQQHRQRQAGNVQRQGEN
jgi:hypothetical protein